MNREADVLIVGSGAVGVCTAYYASRQGLKVVLVDKGEVCSGSSHGNAGLIVPSHCVPLASPSSLTNAWKWLFTPDGPIYLKPRLDRDLFAWLLSFRRACNERHVRNAMPLLRQLSLESSALFEGLAGSLGWEFGYEKTGYVRLYKTEAGIEEAEAEVKLVKSVGTDCELLDRDRVRNLEPSIRMNVLGGISYPEDSHIVPGRFVRGLADHLSREGVEVLPFTEVFDFEISGNNITRVKTTRGDFAAKEIVVTAGSWAPEILRNLGMRLPIQGAKGYSFTFKRPAQWPSRPFSLSEIGVAVSPMGEFLRISGTFAIVGLDLSWNPTRMFSMLREVPTYFPDLDPANLELLEVWRGLRPCSPDGLPFIGRSTRYRNLIVAAGHAMIGVSLAPITGKLVAQIIAGEKPSIDLTALRVERFD